MKNSIPCLLVLEQRGIADDLSMTQDNSTLLISDGSHFVSKDFYPKSSMMKPFLICLVAATLTVDLCSAATTTADFYVSPGGSDTWSGTLPDPVAGQSDGPFATLERARDAVRELKRSKSSDIVVLIREGTYELDKTVVFGLEDSGAEGSTITYAAYPGETPVFSSGREIMGWKRASATPSGLPAEGPWKGLGRQHSTDRRHFKAIFHAL